MLGLVKGDVEEQHEQHEGHFSVKQSGTKISQGPSHEALLRVSDYSLGHFVPAHFSDSRRVPVKNDRDTNKTIVRIVDRREIRSELDVVARQVLY